MYEDITGLENMMKNSQTIIDILMQNCKKILPIMYQSSQWITSDNISVNCINRILTHINSDIWTFHYCYLPIHSLFTSYSNTIQDIYNQIHSTSIEVGLINSTFSSITKVVIFMQCIGWNIDTLFYPLAQHQKCNKARHIDGRAVNIPKVSAGL